MLGADLTQADKLRRAAIRNSRSRCLTPHPHTGKFLSPIAVPSPAGHLRPPVGSAATTTGCRYSAGSRILTSTVETPLLPAPRCNGMPYMYSRVGRRSCARTQSQNHLNRLICDSGFAASAVACTREPAPGRLYRRGSFSESNIAARCRDTSDSPVPGDTLKPSRATEDLDDCRPPTPAPLCSTTSLDFHRHPMSTALRQMTGLGGRGAMGPERCATPRGNNPHPVGLVFQSPYNRHGKVSLQ